MKLLPTLFCGLAPANRGPEFLKGAIAGLPRCGKGFLSFRASMLTLQTSEVDGDLEPTPFACHAQALHPKVCVNVVKLCPEVT